MQLALFVIFGALALGAAISVVLHRRAINSALSLLVCLGALAVLFAQLGAPFIAMIQVIIYAGAIMVLFLTVVMLLDPRSDITTPNRIRYVSYAAIPLALAMGLMIFQGLKETGASRESPLPPGGGSTEAIGHALFTKFLLPFEATSILILVAILGAVILAKRKL